MTCWLCRDVSQTPQKAMLSRHALNNAWHTCVSSCFCDAKDHNTITPRRDVHMRHWLWCLVSKTPQNERLSRHTLSNVWRTCVLSCFKNVTDQNAFLTYTWHTDCVILFSRVEIERTPGSVCGHTQKWSCKIRFDSFVVPNWMREGSQKYLWTCECYFIFSHGMREGSQKNLCTGQSYFFPANGMREGYQ